MPCVVSLSLRPDPAVTDEKPTACSSVRRSTAGEHLGHGTGPRLAFYSDGGGASSHGHLAAALQSHRMAPGLKRAPSQPQPSNVSISIWVPFGIQTLVSMNAPENAASPRVRTCSDRRDAGPRGEGGEGVCNRAGVPSMHMIAGVPSMHMIA